MRRALLGICTVVLAGAWALVSAYPASTQTVPTVTVVHGATTEETFVRDCDDVARRVNVAHSFIVSRDTTDGPLDVRYTTGVRSTVSPPSVATIPDGADHVEIGIAVAVSGSSSF